ncbi:CETN1 [Lepeophtheirus salmonis]|uniref:CETN1 n=1 Tax=Lepeophtheirus salmonis TaxID=72036 RepID=A0A7R8CRP5_LEPSM|nr:CETN1 [Lepeophtheirus salmonis]CAF2904754.1 CETN1 [Lepeophtheirus salmonis]
MNRKRIFERPFDLFDSQGTGFMNAKDLKVAIRALGFEPQKDEMRKMLAGIEDDGTLSFDHFLNIMASKMSEKDTKDDIIKAFKLFDEDDSGKITLKNLKKISAELGENMTDEELREMIDEADRDGDGEVNQDEFFKIMKKANLY